MGVLVPERNHRPPGDDKKRCALDIHPGLLSALDYGIHGRQEINCKVSLLVMVSIGIKRRHSPGDKTAVDSFSFHG